MQLLLRRPQVRVDSINDSTWQGVRNKYWHFDIYMLPTCKKVLAAAEGEGGQEQQQQDRQQQ